MIYCGVTLRCMDESDKLIAVEQIVYSLLFAYCSIVPTIFISLTCLTDMMNKSFSLLDLGHHVLSLSCSKDITFLWWEGVLKCN